MFPQGQHTEAVFQNWPRLYLVLTAKLGSVRVTQMVLALKAWESHGEQLRLGTSRGQERPLVKEEPQWQLKTQDRRVKQGFWGSAPWREPMRRYWWKWSPVEQKTPVVLAITVPWGDLQYSRVEAAGAPGQAVWRRELEKWHRRSWVSLKQFAIDFFMLIEFYVVQIVTALVLPPWRRYFV